MREGSRVHREEATAHHALDYRSPRVVVVLKKKRKKGRLLFFEAERECILKREERRGGETGETAFIRECSV